MKYSAILAAAAATKDIYVKVILAMSLEGDMLESYQSPYDDPTVSEEAWRAFSYIWKEMSDAARQLYVNNTVFQSHAMNLAEKYNLLPPFVKDAELSCDWTRIQPTSKYLHDCLKIGELQSLLAYHQVHKK